MDKTIIKGSSVSTVLFPGVLENYDSSFAIDSHLIELDFSRTALSTISMNDNYDEDVTSNVLKIILPSCFSKFIYDKKFSREQYCFNFLRSIIVPPSKMGEIISQLADMSLYGQVDVSSNGDPAPSGLRILVDTLGRVIGTEETIDHSGGKIEDDSDEEEIQSGESDDIPNDEATIAQLRNKILLLQKGLEEALHLLDELSRKQGQTIKPDQSDSEVSTSD